MNYVTELLSRDFPNLPFELMEFFQIEKLGNPRKIKTIADFIKARKDQSLKIPNAIIINQICEKLSEVGFLAPV